MIKKSPKYWQFLFWVGVVLVTASPAQTQIVPDATLPQNSLVKPSGNSLIIEGGTVAGGNLFHSFSEFSLPTNSKAIFNNSPNIVNILTRITGPNISNIDGVIAAQGNANLFLMNPNGIIFGPNAKLNIGGSFLGTTAESIVMADGSNFSSKNPAASPLLTINIPVGLQLGENPGKIQVLGTGHQLTYNPETFATLRDNRPPGMQVLPGKTLGLLGGDIEFIGGNITAESGRIELGSANSGVVSLMQTPQGFNLGYEGIKNYQNILLRQDASASTSGNGGGDMQVQSRRLDIIESSTLLADTLGTGNGGNLIIKASEKVEVIARPEGFYSSIFASVDAGATGNGGNILIETPNLFLSKGAVVGADTFGAGNAGSLRVRANNIELYSSALLETGVYSGATGNGGNLNIETTRLFMTDGAQLLSYTRAAGDAGNINIKAKEVQIQGVSLQYTIVAASVERFSTGNGGQIIIDTDSLKLLDGGRVGVDSSGLNNGGQVRIKANTIEISGLSREGNPSVLSADSFRASNGGELIVEAGNLIVKDGGLIATGSFDSGNGGNLTIRAQNIQLSGAVPVPKMNDYRPFFEDQTGQNQGEQFVPSGFFTSSVGTGNAGNLTIEAGTLTIKDKAQIAVSSLQGGEAGNLTINARQLLLQNRAVLSAATLQGKEGNINLNINNIQLRNNSLITTNAAGNAGGGNIIFNSDTLTALENSDISANSQQARGGNVTINAQAIFGTEYRLFPTPKSDITATGGTPALGGNVNVNTPNIKATDNLESLPTEFTDLSNQIIQGCSADKGNRFIVTGSGGLPDSPTQNLHTEMVWRDLRPISPPLNPQSSITEIPVKSSSNQPLLEANSWRLNHQGQVELIASSSGLQLQDFWLKLSHCSRKE